MRGLLRRRGGEPFVQQTRPMGLRIDVSNVADAVDLLDGDESR